MYAAVPYAASPYAAPPAGEDADYQPAWGLALQVVDLTVQPAWGIKLQVVDFIEPSWGLALQVVDAATLLATPHHGWGYRAAIGGVDVSARLLGAMTAGGEENTAATAQFSLRPAAGAVDPTAYVGQEVVLHYLWRAADGSQEQALLMFTGTVDTVAIDPATFTLTLDCVDRRADILAAGGADLLPGSLWSVGVFDAGAEALRQQEDRLSTLCAAFDLDPAGGPVLTPWAAQATPDWTLGPADYVWGSLQISLASQSDLVQRVVAEFDFRFSRLRLREARMVYDFGSLHDLAADAICPPTVALIEEAIAAAGLSVLQATAYDCLAQQWWQFDGTWYNYVGWESMVLYAQAWLGRRWAQSVDERYTLTVDCAETGVDPRRQVKIGGALEATFDASAWEADPLAAPVLARPYLATETRHDAVDDTATGRAEADNALATLLAMARREIRSSHRANRVQFDIRLNPFIRRSHTVRFTAAGLDCQGKVFSVSHSLDPDAGEGTLGAKTTLVLAISRPSLPAPTPSPLTAPSAPVPDPISTATAQAWRLMLGNHVGGRAASPAWDESTMQGYICNISSGTTVDGLYTHHGYGGQVATGALSGAYSGQTTPYASSAAAEGAGYYDGEVANPAFVADNAYPWQFRILIPEAEAAARDNLDVPVAATYRVDVPADLFTLTAP